MREFIDLIPSTEPPLLEIETVPPIGKNDAVLALIDGSGTIIDEKDGFGIGRVISGNQTVLYAVKDAVLAYAVIEKRESWAWLLEMFSIVEKSGGMRAVIRYAILEYRRIAVDMQLSPEAISYLEANIASGQFAALVADYRAETMTTYNPDDSTHRSLPLYDRKVGDRPANHDAGQYGWVLTEGMARRGALTENVLPMVPR